MHYAIQFKDQQFDYLSTTSRKPTLKHQLIYLVDGLVTVRLGKNEYALGKGDVFWVPANCLSALSYFPNTHCKVIEASQRLTQPFANKAGYVKVSSLMNILFEKLSHVSDLSEHQQILLSAMQYELLDIQPNLQITSLSRKLSQWETSSKELSIEYQMVMRVKEAEKLRLSGIKESEIAKKLFSGSEPSYQATKRAILGE
ncbi:MULTISPECIES: cupin domain-containing protein [unclassified Vibrio]|uniref:cupin domain-containing protein n=1 Tax=unclassified Vibrio TaxID=2614977 RepID=UPI000A7B1B73|nr:MULTISPECIES: AraC family ligand binding domain-containing protein [unclassified Vibrio]